MLSIMVREISQRKQTPYDWYHLYVESKNQTKWKKNKAKLINTENRLKADRRKMGRRMGKRGKGDQQVQTYNYDVNKSWVCNAQVGDDII